MMCHVQSDAKVNGEGDSSTKELYGPWMVVQSARGRRRNVKGIQDQSSPLRLV